MEIRNDVVRKSSCSEHDFLRELFIENHRSDQMSEQVHLRGGGDYEDQIKYDYHTSLYTYTGNEIPIYVPCAGSDASIISEKEESALLNDLEIGENQIAKLKHADPNYNCHMYTFARYYKKGWITESNHVLMILKDHKYQVIPENLAGKGLKEGQRDVAIYFQDNKLPHSGRVVKREGNNPLFIDNKLGKYGVYRLYPEILKKIYGEIRYYRSDASISSTIG